MNSSLCSYSEKTPPYQFSGLVMDELMESDCIGSADALDAVICAFAAAGVASGQLEMEAGEQSAVEGLIAVHR